MKNNNIRGPSVQHLLNYGKIPFLMVEVLSANYLKESRHQNETVAVIGSGIAGCLTAYKLASEGYLVTIIEEQRRLFSGTSKYAIQAHLGGLYSGNPETARECLGSAIQVKKAMPFALTERKPFFLVAHDSEISMDEYVSFYNDLANYYGSLPPGDQVFGPPEKFFRILNAEEHNFAKNVEGGIATQEPGLDMQRVKKMLLGKCRSLGVRTVTKTSVVGARMQNDGYTLALKKGDVTEEANFNQVVNAGGYKARLLDHEFGDRTKYTLYLKSWNLVRNGSGQQPLPPFYIVRGDFMHHGPIGNEELASLVVATNDKSYLGKITYGDEYPELPLEWENILRTGRVPGKTERQRRILEYAGDRFLHNAKFEPIDLVPGVAVSFSDSRQDRTRRGANVVASGWQTIIPTKATNALELAEEARINVLKFSAQKGDI